MITADEARKITEANMKDVRHSFSFMYAIKEIERFVKDASSRGESHFSYNVNVLATALGKADLRLRKAVAEELRKNGFSYCETQRSINCVWFEVSW